MADSERRRWPVNPDTGEPIPPRETPGYYPGYHTLDQQAFWDAATRDTIRTRVHDVPPIRFFTAEEAALLTAICARVLPQDDRDEAHRIPIVNHIDARLFENRHEGYRYEDMPPDREAHRLGLSGIDAVARHLFQEGFRKLLPEEQDAVLLTLHEGRPPAGQEIWARMPVHRYWMLLVGDVVAVYYAHPWAWDEIGFGGPAYPRGYFRLERGEPEPWEKAEQRYLWRAPASARSEESCDIGLSGHEAAPGRGGKQ
ncbi:MAG TPA: gluconate 2-dehydrogenase subunit 3 family protein [Vicinamibacterales bacterium]|jgi:hypothetical protein